MKRLQGVFPSGRKRLQHDIAYPQLISGIFERHNVMRIAGNTFGIKSLARSVHGLWLSSTTRRNPHNSCLKWLAGTCHWSPHTSNVGRSNLGTGRLARTCPWAKHNCRGLHTRFPRSTPLTNVGRVDHAGRCSQCTLGVGF